MEVGTCPRRPGKRATIAAEAEGLLAEIAAEVERERREGISENNGMKDADATRQKIASSLDDDGILIHKTHPKHPDFEKNMENMGRSNDDRKTATKAAALFGTNRVPGCDPKTGNPCNGAEIASG